MAPPHTNAPPTVSPISLSFSADTSMLQKVSTKSDVPQALLMARDDVLGIISPAAAQMDTTMGVILFPGTPPMLWKSYTGPLSNLMTSPVSTMARAKAAISSMSIPSTWAICSKCTSRSTITVSVLSGSVVFNGQIL